MSHITSHHITGHSRPPGEVGLSPRQYTKWNVVGRARSTGDLSQQGRLPEVYRTACTRGCAHQTTKYQRTKNPRPCVRVVYIAGDTLRHQPMGANHMTVLQLLGPMAFHVLQWCHPMLASTTRASCCTRIITLYGTRKWIQARATLKSMKNQCHGQRKSLTVQLNSRPVRRIELYTKICTDMLLLSEESLVDILNYVISNASIATS